MLDKNADSIIWTEKVLAIDPNHISTIHCKGINKP